MANWLRRFLRIEPAVSFGTWFAQTLYAIFTNWALIWATLGGLAVTVSGILQGYPLGVHGLILTALGTTFLIYAVVSRARLWASRTSVERATERYIEARVGKSTVNPLDVTFTQERIDIRDIIRPLSNEVRNKTFVRCQIVGPINVLLIGSTNIANPRGTACEAVYCDNNVYISNAAQLIDCDFRDCEFFNVTFMVLPDHYKKFTENIMTSWITSNPDGYTHINPDGTVAKKDMFDDVKSLEHLYVDPEPTKQL